MSGRKNILEGRKLAGGNGGVRPAGRTGVLAVYSPPHTLTKNHVRQMDMDEWATLLHQNTEEEKPETSRQPLSEGTCCFGAVGRMATWAAHSPNVSSGSGPPPASSPIRPQLSFVEWVEPAKNELLTNVLELRMTNRILACFCM